MMWQLYPQVLCWHPDIPFLPHFDYVATQLSSPQQEEKQDEEVEKWISRY